IGYPFGKLDIIAVPEFGYGAMENAGAITFRDVLLLLDPATTSIDVRRMSTSVISHELAHQWFGNIVTPAWWDDIWLNEAFATWMEYHIVQQVRPDQAADLQRADQALDAMERDALPSARQIRQPIDTNDAIYGAFDGITYAKGMAVLGMFEAYVGADSFRKAIALHLTKFRFGNATAEDFFASVSEGTGKELTPALRSFIEQNGLPQVELSLACANKESPKVTLRQSRFLPILEAGDTKHHWQIPVCVRSDASQACWMLDRVDQTNALHTKTCPKWVMPNANAIGYYRFALDADALRALVTAAADGKLAQTETMALASNVRAGLYNGTVSARAALDAATVFLRSNNHQVVSFARDILVTIREIIDAGMLGKFEMWTRTMLPADISLEVIAGEDDERHLTRVIRAEIAIVLARDQALRTKAQKKGELALAALEKGQPLGSVISIDLLPTVLSTTLDVGGPQVHERIAALLGKTTDSALRRYLLLTLAYSHDSGLAEKSAELMLDPRVRSNETRAVLFPLSHTRETRPVVWRFVQTHFDDYIAKVSLLHQGLTPLLTADFCTPESVNEVEHFFVPKLDTMAGGARSLLVATETISACAAMANTQRDSAHGVLWGFKPPRT
ncbi:MAG: ERAP1-like C-terminal domain-containing protein, partial [Clostridia bacterium]|nr:ERAP1-like C-terminal domain-containing protein [Deltaproteobacteria bacterium]